MRLFGAKLNLTAAIGLAVVARYLIVVLLAPLIAPYEQENITENADPWIIDAQHWLGLDNLGPDSFSRLIFGTRLSVGLSLVMTALAFVLGVTAGFAAAVRGGWLDTIQSRLVDPI